MATQKLPTPGLQAEAGLWGNILNQYLRVSLDAKGGINTWTTATRPVSPDDSCCGVNTTTDVLERWDATGSQWVTILNQASTAIAASAVTSTAIAAAPTKEAITGTNVALNLDSISTSLATKQAKIVVKDEGTDLVTGPSSLNFVGNGVSATNTAGDVTVTVNTAGLSVRTTEIVAAFSIPQNDTFDIYIAKGTATGYSITLPLVATQTKPIYIKRNDFNPAFILNVLPSGTDAIDNIVAPATYPINTGTSLSEVVTFYPVPSLSKYIVL